MFKKNKSKDVALTPAFDPIAPLGKTIIGEQIIIEGAISGNGDLVIEGSVKGRIEIKAHHLTIGPKGNVESEIHATDVTISGKLVGNINAKEKVIITREAEFNGEIKARSISVEDGALLKAVIELSDRSKEEGSSAGKPEDKTLPETKEEPPEKNTGTNKGL